MKEEPFDILGRCLLGLLAAASLVAVVLAGTRGLSLQGTTKINAAQSEPGIAPVSAPTKAEKQQQLQVALEQKIGECYARGGVARLDPVSGYTGCDLPVRKSRDR